MTIQNLPKNITSVLGDLAYGNMYDKDKETLDGIPMSNACATRASITANRKGIKIPKKYRDFIGQIGEMKGKPVISTATKFLKFMKENHKGKVIHVKKPKNYKDLCDAMCGNEGLYIMTTPKGEGYTWTGHVSAWDGNKTIDGNHVNDAADAYLFVD